MAVESIENRICIRMASIYEDVRMRLYFKGEALKRKDADYCVVQASTDEDLDMMRGFAESAMNEVAQTVVKRMAEFDWEIGVPLPPPSDEPPADETPSGIPDGSSDVDNTGSSSDSYSESSSDSSSESGNNEEVDSAQESSEEYLMIVYVPYQRQKPSDESRMRKIAEKAIFNYVVNFCIGEWLGVVSPELSREFIMRNDTLMFNVQRAFAGLSPMLRRRATDLAGI